MRQVPLPSTPWALSSSMEHVPLRPSSTTICTTTVAMYDYFHYRRENKNFHYIARTSTSLYETRSAPNARFEGITNETITLDRMLCCMRCSRLHHIRERSLHAPRFPCHRHVGTRLPGSPTIFCTFRKSTLLHRYLSELSDHRNGAVAPFSLSLTWHPFRSATVTNAS